MSTRDRIIESADQLFYEQGFGATSFGDIAAEVRLSRGNFYHHFKTKDEILDAVIERRLAATSVMLEKWEAGSPEPLQRIESFVRILLVNQTKIMRFGCPVGSLCSELARHGHPLQPDANRLFVLFRTWLGRQFELLGVRTDSDELAMHVLARSQGIAALAQSFGDRAFVDREVRALNTWVKSQVRGGRRRRSSA